MNAMTDYDELAMLKTPPHSLEAEQSVLGGLMIDQGAWDRLDGMLTAEDFYRPEHRLIFAAAAAKAHDNQPIDPITLADALSHAGTLEQAGGIAYLAELAMNTPSAANIRAYAKAVADRAALRALIVAGGEIADLGYNADGQPVGELIEAAQQRVMALGQHGYGELKLHCSSRFAALIDEWERRARCEGLVGLSTGLEALDRRTNGLGDGNLVIVAARPGQGKTVLAMNLAEHTAVIEQKPVLVFSMEMPTEELLDRVAASLGRIPYALIRTGKVFDHPEYDAKVMPTISRLKAAPLYIDDRTALTVPQMRSTARKLHAKTPLRLVVVDYIQLARGATQGKNGTREQEVSSIARGLKGLAKDLGCPVIALSQLNRDVEKRPNKRPVLSDLRDSGAIEQDADMVWFIYRDEYYHPEDSPEKGIAEINVAKLRNGQPGVDKIAANLSLMRFDNLAHDYQPPAVEPQRQKRRGGFEY